MWEIVGFISSICGILYPIPQVKKTLKHKRALGISRWFLLLWFLDKFCTFIYVSHLQDYPLMLKYGIGISFVAIIGFYKIFPRKKGLVSGDN